MTAVDPRPAATTSYPAPLPTEAASPEVTSPSVRDVIKAYVGLTKPRIIELLLITTVPVMFLAAGGVPGLGVVAATLVGGILASGSANTINCVLDRDIDEQMRRTRRRPLPRHAVSPRSAMVFGIVLGVLATLELGFFVNWLSSVLALVANLFYVFVYTMVLKRRTVQNIVWGGIAGCFPTLIGWTAVTNDLAWTPLVLFGVVFLWTPPHTWALAMRYREDYASVDVPMLPVVATPVATARQILVYSILMVITSLALWPVADTGFVYPLAAVVLGVVFLREAFALLARANTGAEGAALRPMRLFHFSNIYLALLFIAAAIDPLLH
ncbi:protoheme IX farnesyltransferase [Kribbella italica]|uniref:Protoheme IX farnesyltransferase n=1 Tax=Kribbella italica TaxID=1540520 RepID=A0A7W9J471_9ACTN|nr:protoheme IX farnesyltransferase [Kribbella italica]